jgi:replication fork protection complex subunit Csm3/Swi3
MYQLWLDDLYPRAKFADGLAMIEALGHKKRIQMMRKEWINEGKPRGPADSDLDENDLDRTGQADVHGASKDPTTPPERDSDQNEQPLSSPRLAPSHDTVMDGPEEDELDALLTEDYVRNSVRATAVSSTNNNMEDDMFADEAEIMAEMESF